MAEQQQPQTTPPTPAPAPAAPEAPAPAAAAPAAPAPAAPQTEPAAPAAPATPAEPKVVVPERYDLKLPEDSYLDPSVPEKIASFAKERGLSNEQAQQVLNQENEAAKLYIQERSEAWKKEALNDKEIGGNEEQLNRKVALANRVVEKFGDDTLKKELDKYGYGNHPGLIKLLSRVGEQFGDDYFVRGGSAHGAKSLEEVFYGGTTK